jgi:hypothetical protein
MHTIIGIKYASNSISISSIEAFRKGKKKQPIECTASLREEKLSTNSIILKK